MYALLGGRNVERRGMVLYRLGIVSTSCNTHFKETRKHLLDHGNMAFRGDSCPVHVPSFI